MRLLLGRTIWQLHQAASEGVLRERHRFTGGTADRDFVRAQKALVYSSVATRGVLGLVSAALFVVLVVTGLWDPWLDELALGVGWLAALGGFVSAARLLAIGAARGRHARWLEPSNPDLIWQGAVVAGLVLWAI